MVFLLPKSYIIVNDWVEHHKAFDYLSQLSFIHNTYLFPHLYSEDKLMGKKKQIECLSTLGQHQENNH